MKYKYLLFDLDNTLVDDDENRKYAIKKIMEERNEIVNETRLNEFVTHDNKFWKDRAQGIIKDPYKFKTDEERTEWVRGYRFTLFFKNIAIEDGININHKYIEYLKEYIIPIKDSKKILEYLKNKGYILYIITNSPKNVVKNKLEKANINKYFTKTFTAEDAGHMKPHIDFFNNFYKELKDKEKMLIIGDELNHDIVLGMNNDVDTCWFNNKNEDISTEYKPTYIIRNLIELKDIL